MAEASRSARVQIATGLVAPQGTRRPRLPVRREQKVTRIISSVVGRSRGRSLATSPHTARRLTAASRLCPLTKAHGAASAGQRDSPWVPRGGGASGACILYLVIRLWKRRGPRPPLGEAHLHAGGSRVLPVRGLGQEGRPSPACGVHTGLWRSPRTRRLALPGETQTVVRGKARKGPYKHGLRVFTGLPDSGRSQVFAEP